jgi:hypothetical protein
MVTADTTITVLPWCAKRGVFRWVNVRIWVYSRTRCPTLVSLMSPSSAQGLMDWLQRRI